MKGRIALAAAVTVIVVGGVLHADLENHVYTSRAMNVRVAVPRGWRESDAPSYPNVLLWMMRGDAKIVMTAEPLTHELYCSWPVMCRAGHDLSTLTQRYACALREKLQGDHHMHVGLIEAGPKENADAGLPSVWFEYDDGTHFLRQAIAVADDDDRAISLVLETSTNDLRAGSVRSFEQALRTLRPLSTEELAAAPLPAATAGSDLPRDGGGIVDANVGSATPTSGSDAAGSAASGSVRGPQRDPTGPCS
ncbi:MAG TPA: hypothetical protein VGG28_26240 [Kofleriaceae bacterium]|jgi:hypothetical protein